MGQHMFGLFAVVATANCCLRNVVTVHQYSAVVASLALRIQKGSFTHSRSAQGSHAGSDGYIDIVEVVGVLWVLEQESRELCGLWGYVDVGGVGRYVGSRYASESVP